MIQSSDFHNFAARLRGFMEATTATQNALAKAPEIERTDRHFNQMALELFRLQFAYNLAYRKICEVRQITPESIADWCQIPAVPTGAFKEFELSCLPPVERTAFFLSSGTTETRPSRHFHNPESLSLYEQSVLSWFRCAEPAAGKRGITVQDFEIEGNSRIRGAAANPREVLPVPEGEGRGEGIALQGDKPTQSFFSLTPNKTAAPHSSLVHMFECIGRSGYFKSTEFFGAVAVDGYWTMDLARLRTRLEQAGLERKPVMVVGTAFSFVHLLDYLSEEKIAYVLPPGSYVLETGGYKGRSRSLPKSELHLLITTCLGVPPGRIVCEYGMAELCSQAYDNLVSGSEPESNVVTRAQNTVFCFPPWARVRIVSPENGDEVREGEAGLIRVLDLANVYSVMAIQTEDVAVRRGRGFELIGRVGQAEPRGCSLMAVG